MMRKPAPDAPSVTFLGTDEKIVDIDAIRARMAGWSNGRLEMIEDGEHEVLMEDPGTRAKIMDQIAALFDQHR